MLGIPLWPSTSTRAFWGSAWTLSWLENCFQSSPTFSSLGIKCYGPRWNRPALYLLQPNHVFFLLHLLHVLLLNAAAWLTLWTSGTSSSPTSTEQCCSAQCLPRLAGCSMTLATCLCSAPLCATSCYTISWLASWRGPCQLVEPRALPEPCQAPLFPQRPRYQQAPLLLCPRKDPLCEAWETEEKVHAIQLPAKILLLDWAPSHAASLLPVVYLLFCYAVEKAGGLGLDNSFYILGFFTYVPLLGVKGLLGLLFMVRFPESNWFVRVTQMNQTPMHTDHHLHPAPGSMQRPQVHLQWLVQWTPRLPDCIPSFPHDVSTQLPQSGSHDALPVCQA